MKKKQVFDRIGSKLVYVNPIFNLTTFKANQAKSDLTNEKFKSLITDIYHNFYVPSNL